MRFWEAMRALEEGNPVRVKIWDEDWYIQRGTKNTVVDEEGDEIDVWFNFDEWEVYEEPVKTYTFQELIPFLKEERKVKRKGWDFTIYKGMDECFYMHGERRGRLRMQLEDFESNDWIVVDE